jgi:hypothetical protein
MRNWHGNLSPFGKWHTAGSAVSALIAYAANSITPQLVAAFKEGVYGKNSELSTFGGVLNHVRNGNATMVDADGLLKWAPHNIILQSEDGSVSPWNSNGVTVSSDTTAAPNGTLTADTLSITSTTNARWQQPFSSISGVAYTARYWVKLISGDPNARIWDPSSGTSLYFVATSEWQLITLSFVAVSTLSSYYVRFLQGTNDVDQEFAVWGAHLYRSDLGGMVNNPNADVGFETYVPTTDAARFLPRENHHVYSGSSWVKQGYLHEPEAATNLLLNSGTLSTQNVTVTAVPNTLHFTGTGTVTLSGTATDGPLVGTGTGENNRVNLTFTPSAGTLTLTVSGTVTNADLVADPFVSSHIATAGSTVIRAADTLPLPIANIPYPEPVVIGPELVTNGTFDTGVSGWTGFTWVSGGVASVGPSSEGLGKQDMAIEVGKVYRVAATRLSTSPYTGLSTVRLGSSDQGSNYGTITFGTDTDDTELSITFVATSTSVFLSFGWGLGSAGQVVYHDNISVKEANPLAVSFGYKALVTYADTSNPQEVEFIDWSADSDNKIRSRIDNQFSKVGQVEFEQEAVGDLVVVALNNAYGVGINVPMSIASRNGSTFLNIAVDGTALTADTTPVAFPDLSTTDLIIAPSGGPQIIQEFIMWGGTTGDIGDAGIAETSA